MPSAMEDLSTVFMRMKLIRTWIRLHGTEKASDLLIFLHFILPESLFHPFLDIFFWGMIRHQYVWNQCFLYKDQRAERGKGGEKWKVIIFFFQPPGPLVVRSKIWDNIKPQWTPGLYLAPLSGVNLWSKAPDSFLSNSGSSVDVCFPPHFVRSRT